MRRRSTSRWITVPWRNRTPGRRRRTPVSWNGRTETPGRERGVKTRKAVADKWSAVKRLVPPLLCAAAFLAAAPAYASEKPNPFGIVIVRFDAGTSPAQMRAAIVKAGGDVVTDLSPVGAMAVAPVTPDFGAKIRASSYVASFFSESMFDGPLTLDGKEGGGSVGPFDFSKTRSFPDPWHDAPSFLGVTNPQGILQWDDARMNVPAAWATTLGDRTVNVAVLDTGVQASHRELKDNVVGKTQTFVPCAALKHELGEKALKAAGLTDCGTEDREGHGTWVASRIAGALNGFATNGVAPRVQVSSYKVIASGFGGLPAWIPSGLLTACSDNVDLVNMSITGYLDPTDPTDAQTYLLFNDVVRYCLDRGVTIFAAAGNEHVRIDRVAATIGGRTLSGVGRVSGGVDGVATTPPGGDSANFDLRGMLETPAGVPGVVMVSATNNGNGAAPAADPFGFGMHVGARDQLAYYSSYGSRVDPAALVTRLRATARQTMTNFTGPDDPNNTSPTYDGRPCNSGYCHLDTSVQIPFAEAYGAGIVDAGSAVSG